MISQIRFEKKNEKILCVCLFNILKDVSSVSEVMEEQRGAVGGAKMEENQEGTGEGNKTTQS